MRITLQIENVDRLETGGQVSYSCADRGFDIGRHEHLDWSLPDPERVVSGKHCEVRFEGGNFVLYDVSTNGTFLNGSPNRMDNAHALRSGDRIMIGDYIVKVTLDAEQAMGAGFSGAPTAEPPAQPASWQTPQPSAPPVQEPQWPAAPPPGQPAYPAEDANNPWNTPTSGMEGRHAPPSQTPGIGTPADDVWSQQGHGWGSADPALYDPQARQPDVQQARPAQADPLDHLAAQPSVQTQETPSLPVPPPAQPDTSEPLFKMPALEPETAADALEETRQPDPAGNAFPEPAAVSPEKGIPEASPFPESAPVSEPAPEEQAADSLSEPPADPVELPQVSEAPVVEAVPEPAAPEPVSKSPPPAVKTSGKPVGPDILKAFAEGAGIPESILADRDPEEFAREMGSILNGITGDVMGLLQARSKVKAMTRNANRTLISRSGNNALKFSPTPQMALQTMLAQNVEETGYLPLPKAMSEAFKDIQKHHVWTYAAMQKAAARFDETLSPNAVEEEGQVSKSTFGNQKAKLWERLQERWTSLSGAYDDGVVGVFTQYFTESYEEFSNDESEQ